MGKILGALAVIALIGLVAFIFLSGGDETPSVDEEVPDTQAPEVEDTETQPDNATSTVVGTSVEGNDITAYHFGEGDTELLFVGGIHGGYAWNTVAVAHELIDYLEENRSEIPETVRVTVIPVLNPDGLEEVVGTTGRFEESAVPSGAEALVAGRFNARDVDLNRNFDCDWQAQGVWQSRSVSGGSAAFSEPESSALRDYVAELDPAAVVVYYSAAGGVFASNCHGEVLPETAALTAAYAEASGYRPYEEYNFYEVTGDMANWLAREGVPTISVLLTDHENVEWDKNRAGVEAVLEYYAGPNDEAEVESTEN